VDPDTAVVGLWVTAGTAAGTVQLSSFPGAWGGAVAGGTLDYFADDGNLGFSLWRTDGTVAGTEAVLSGLEAPEMMGAFGERVVFRSLRDFSVWASDGTSAGTRRIGHSFAATRRIAVRPDAFYFVGVRDFDSSGSPASGTKALARSDGSPEGTAFVPLPEGRRLALDGNLAPVEAGLAVTTETPAGGTEAWILAPDGSWRLLAAFAPVSGSSAPYELEALGDRIVFGADDGAHGKEPWVSDGSAAGSSLLADLVLNLIGCGDCLCDFFPQQFAETPAQPMHGHLQRALLQAEARHQFSVR
jgi:ELWxxDGT repeat protein